MKFFDKEGNEVEAFTEDEVKVKQQEAIDSYLQEHPDNSSDLESANNALIEANKKIKEFEELNKGGNDDQKKRLLKERDEALAKVADVEKNLMGEIGKLKDTFVGGTKSKVIERLSGGDGELKKKLELEYDNFKGDALTEAEIQERAVKAFTIATGNKPTPNFMDSVGDSGVRGVNQQRSAQSAETDNSKGMRKAFGISDADVEKFSPKVEN